MRRKRRGRRKDHGAWKDARGDMEILAQFLLSGGEAFGGWMSVSNKLPWWARWGKSLSHGLRARNQRTVRYWYSSSSRCSPARSPHSCGGNLVGTYLLGRYLGSAASVRHQPQIAGRRAVAGGDGRWRASIRERRKGGKGSEDAQPTAASDSSSVLSPNDR